jgi:multimeric flavodoxin WrbA
MHILVISGSRNRQGQTARAISSICKGLEAGGATYEVIFLPELKLERCRQCDPSGDGQCTREGSCIVKDDFPTIVEKINKADAIVFATPVYFMDLSESMRGLLDRYRRVRFHRVIAGGGVSTPPTEPGKPVIALCYAGGMSGNGTTSCANKINEILQMCGFDVVDVILARRQNLEFKIPILELTGEWLATKPCSGPPLAPSERYWERSKTAGNDDKA